MLALVLLPLTVMSAELRVPGAEIAKALDQALVGTQVRLHHDTLQDGKRAASSSVTLSEALGGKRFEFSIPEQVFDLGNAGQVEYRVNDVNVTHTAVAAGERDYVLTLTFEDEGVEVRSRHVGGMFNLGGAVPDLQMNQMKMEVTLTTSSVDDRPALASAKVRLTADIQPDGKNGAFLGSALQSTGYKEELRRAIEREAEKSLCNPEVISAVNAKLWEAVSQRAEGKPMKARFEGTDLVIALTPPTPKQAK